jgi:hypothetical protein
MSNLFDMKITLEEKIQEIKTHEEQLNGLINDILINHSDLKVYTQGIGDKECSLRYGLKGSKHIKIDIHKALS